WVVKVEFSDQPQYSDNPQWFEGLIFTMRIPFDSARNILFKYGQGSLYCLHYSISYRPEISQVFVNGSWQMVVTDMQFREVSMTMDPAFYKCRTIDVTCSKEEDSGGNKKYIVHHPGTIQKVTFEQNGIMTEIPNPPTEQANPAVPTAPGTAEAAVPPPVSAETVPLIQNSG
ncbi:unnamed protein product, partial [marine sediment metagenome]